MDKTEEVIDKTMEYIAGAQDFTAGEYYGSFWSEKAYHGPLLDWHAGGSHHHRSAGSAGLCMWEAGCEEEDSAMKKKAELCFDWLAARQHPRGGWFEIQNNEKPSDWENTGLEELSAISTAFAVHGMGYALLKGLSPKKIYMNCLENAGHWLLSLERPEGSGKFPHHERSPYDTLNADAHAAESLALIFRCLDRVYGKSINIFLHGAKRGLNHTISMQYPNGLFPYRAGGGSTINYSSVVMWCFLNILEILPEKHLELCVKKSIIKRSLDAGASFLRGCVKDNGLLDWEKNETSTARHNIWTYLITCNVLRRIGGAQNIKPSDKLMDAVLKLVTPSGLLPMRDIGEEITECLFMQSDFLLFIKGAGL